MDESARPGPFLTSQWLDLVMLSWAVDPDLLEPLVPRGTELDAFEGRTVASVVGLRFEDVRVRGLAIPFHRRFPELNLRFYVRREVGGERRRGVVFVKELVPLRAVAWLARLAYGERYFRLPMRATGSLPQADAKPRALGTLRYAWRRQGRWESLQAEVAGAAALPAGESEAAFITEHYWGYARQRDGGTLEYEVEHPRWQVWDAHAVHFDADAGALYGAGWATALSGAPSSAFVADGSAVVVRRGRRIAP
ncbi:MAG TPA: DUF2071 domain-containing protein [Planctomycetota bacterium]